MLKVFKFFKSYPYPYPIHIISFFQEWSIKTTTGYPVRGGFGHSSVWDHITNRIYVYGGKLEKILKDSVDSIPSPSVKIQIMVGKVCLRCKGKTSVDFVNKLFVFKSLLRSPSNVLPCYLK